MGATTVAGRGATATLRVLAVVGAATLGVACQGAVAGPGDSAEARVVEIVTDAMGFAPVELEIRQHETVRFIVRNREAIPHEVFVGSDAGQDEHRALHALTPPDAQSDVPHMGRGAYVPALGTDQFVHRFDQPGRFVVGCHLPGHWEAGMMATIVVRGP